MRSERGSSGPAQRREQRGEAAGAGSPSRAAAFTSRALLRLGWHRPLSPGQGPWEATWGARAPPLQLPKCRVSHAGTRRAARTGLQAGRGAAALSRVCPQLGTSDSRPRSHLSGRARQKEEGGGGRGAGMPRRADSTEPRTAKINKEAGDQVCSHPVPSSPRGLCTQPQQEHRARMG